MNADYTIDDFHMEVLQFVRLEAPEWRIGQTYFNVLARRRPDLSEQIRSGPLDPFYRNERVPEFVAFLAENWQVLA